MNDVTNVRFNLLVRCFDCNLLLCFLKMYLDMFLIAIPGYSLSTRIFHYICDIDNTEPFYNRIEVLVSLSVLD